MQVSLCTHKVSDNNHRKKIANYNDCNSQFLIGFASVVKILQWLCSILQQLYNATSCLHLYLFINTFNTTLSQRLYNDCIQKHNRITMFQLAGQITTIVFGTLRLCLVQCKSIVKWLNSQCFYNILVKYTIIVICNFFPVNHGTSICCLCQIYL